MVPVCGLPAQSKGMAELRHGNAGGPFRGNQKKHGLFHILSLDCILIGGVMQENGDNFPSFVTRNLEKMNKNLDLAYQEHVIKSIAGTLYGGGSNSNPAFVNCCEP